MDLPEAWSQRCICGHDFTTPQGYSLHHNSCSKSKKWLEAVLGQAREVQVIKKCCRAEAKLPVELPSNDLPLPGTHQQVEFLIQESPSSLMFICVCQAGKAPVDYKDLDQSLAEHRTCCGHCRLLKCYQDIAPEAPAALPPTLQIIMASTQAELNVPCSLSLSPSLVPASLVRKTLKSSCNIFGLFRQYYMTGLPDHDPGEHIQLNDLHTSTSLVRDYSPYPNQSAFLLGEWYWNGGEKKSQSSFQNLIKIVGHPDFHPEDVAAKNWRLIDTRLSGESKGSNKEDDWEDKDDSRLGGWTKTPIRVNAPFHKRTLQKCPKEFEAGILHHRKLMTIIRKRITRPSVHPHLYLEPYKLFWQPDDATELVRVHGELYTSEVFINAHNKLQDSPPEPECSLPRVVLGLIFSSDGT